MNGVFKRGECNDIIELLCTGWLFCPVFIIVLYVWLNCMIMIETMICAIFFFWISAI